MLPSRHALFGARYLSAISKPVGKLVLEDGTTFHGTSIGAQRSVQGECVFTTGMVGYPENVTDPSFYGQILAFTQPLIGNYGVSHRGIDKDGMFDNFESKEIWTSGVLMQNYSEEYSHWQADRSLSEWLIDKDVPGLSGIDTRALTKHLRTHGTMAGNIVIGEEGPALDFYNPLVGTNVIPIVSRREVVTYGDGDIRIVAVDCGMKNNQIRELMKLPNVSIKRVPWDHDFHKEEYDGLFMSNGPGEPHLVVKTIENLREAMKLEKPIFGICLGQQLLAHAAGGSCWKLRYGHRGQNQPVTEVSTGAVYITAQNHGYAVDENSLDSNWTASFLNANDGSVEGIVHKTLPFSGVQFHPESRPGPYDTTHLFSNFYDEIIRHKLGEKSYALPPSTVKPPSRVNAKPGKVLVLGSGGLQIGQAGEFDYSGSQAIKALKEEGVSTILMNPNVATVQTAEGFADKVYFLPVSPKYIEQVIEKEKPDGILLSFGGQTALNAGLELDTTGVLAKHGVRILGTTAETINTTEDRQLFNDAMAECDIPTMPSVAIRSLDAALEAANKLGYPIIVRSAFALGGLGSGFAHNDAELTELVTIAMTSSPQLLVEKSFKGWKEVEYEVVRDANDNCITVCNMENFDPMGTHTGDSIVVAPSQTLSNEEYHMLRSASIRAIRHLGVVGECNIQYTLDPHSMQYYAIEVNPRLSRSSALASKATGYPLAFVAAKLSLGITLPEIENSVTKSTSACFEPSLDYIVTKIPRFDLKKFDGASDKLSSGMKSVGEVMAIGRSFEESFQKALRMTDVGIPGFSVDPKVNHKQDPIATHTPHRVPLLAEAFAAGRTVEDIHNETKIDRWFLYKLKGMHDLLSSVTTLEDISKERMRDLKQAGFSDIQIAEAIGLGPAGELKVRRYRKGLGVTPFVKQIDTLSAEIPARTNYLYMTYNGSTHDLKKDEGSILTLGSGTYRIGSSVEFDYGNVMVTRAMREYGEKTVTINCNPETVSTDFDECDKLYFEELSLERTLDVHDHESPKGVVVSCGGQGAQNLAGPLHSQRVPIMGTHPDQIDRAEDRTKFSAILDAIGVRQPAWKELTTKDEARVFAQSVGFPVLVRPSFVLSGAAMNVAYSEQELEGYLDLAAEESGKITISKFFEGFREVEVDGVAKDGKIVNYAIAEHIENAGVHSGDAFHVLPSDNIDDNLRQTFLETSGKITNELAISGPFNVQYLWDPVTDEMFVIECNLRASRSMPFSSKTTGVNFPHTIAKVLLGHRVPYESLCDRKLSRVGVKAPQFSFQRLLGADPVLGVEMASTGEVACYGRTKEEAFLKAWLAASNTWMTPEEIKRVLFCGAAPDNLQDSVDKLRAAGVAISASPELAALITGDVDVVQADEMEDLLISKNIQIAFNIPERGDDATLRRRIVDLNVPLITNAQLVNFMATSLKTAPELWIEAYRK